MANDNADQRKSAEPMVIDEWVETLGQLTRLPFAVAALGMNLFTQTASRFLDQATQLTSGVAPETSTPLTPPSTPAAIPPKPRPVVKPVSTSAAPTDQTAEEHGVSQPFVQEDPKTNSPGTPLGDAQTHDKELSMADTNLNDDMLKLVSYSIVCIERGNEHVLLCNGCELFADNMTDCDFDSWVIADYCEKHRVRCDRKYLRVAYQVLGRWEKPDLQFEVKQLERLDDIAKAIEDRNHPRAGKSVAKKGD